jgi:replicative DNA helicase
VLSDYYDRIDQLSQRGEDTFGVPSGFIDLDRLLGGMQPSDFLIIAGRPGTGKTAFMLSAAKNAAQIHKKRVAIFSLEMSNEQLVQRLISQETGIESQRLRTGKLNEDEWPLFTHAIEVLSDTHIFLDDTPSLTPLQLRTKSRRLYLEYGLDLVLVDYLQMMSGGMRIENRVQEVSYISRNLKVLARELNVPVLAAAQLSRAIEQRADKEPQLSDLRESGSLEQDADVVMFIHRPELYERDTLMQNVAQIKVSKHRNGPVGMVELVFRSNLAKFENAATRR